MATVLAAVDHARVRKPVHAERGAAAAAEEETVEFDVTQQAMFAAEQQVRARAEASLMSSAATQLTPTEKTVHISQVRTSKKKKNNKNPWKPHWQSVGLFSSTSSLNFYSVGYRRSKGAQKPMWILAWLLPLYRIPAWLLPPYHSLQFQKLLCLKLSIAMR